jgi:hypothetical protein
MSPPSLPETWTPEDFRRALYRAGYEYAARRVREGLDPEAVRADLATMAAYFDRPFSADTERGVEDALAGRLPTL